MLEDDNTSDKGTIDSNNIEPISSQIDVCTFGCTETNIKRCRKCNRPFCIMHCNHVSPNFCKDCFKDINIISNKFMRTFDYVADNGQLYIKTEERVRHYLDGIDWPFITPWIDSLTDDELKNLWVFHHYILRLIEAENDTRNIERNRKLREQPVPRLISQTTTKTTKVAKVQQPETPETLKKKWQKMGMSEDMIKMMLDALEKK